jgi:hypothetical protein
VWRSTGDRIKTRRPKKRKTFFKKRKKDVNEWKIENNQEKYRRRPFFWLGLVYTRRSPLTPTYAVQGRDSQRGRQHNNSKNRSNIEKLIWRQPKKIYIDFYHYIST